MSHPNSTTPKDERDEARTPDWLFEWLDSDYHFDVDLAATDDNRKGGLPFMSKDRMDALNHPWFTYDDDAYPLNTVGFCNCPYSNIAPWFDKAAFEALQGFTTVLVVPTFNGDAYWDIPSKHATTIINLIGRVEFLRPDGTPFKGNPRGTCIVVFTPEGGPPVLEWVFRDEIMARFK